ncbi:MAG: hypothetical protein NKF70_10220 [Methanobacterium sp. ERen5]|nr:MAG: hypothetical protein NKF70_10220 [Methanobacterium sp. ERen5]
MQNKKISLILIVFIGLSLVFVSGCVTSNNQTNTSTNHTVKNTNSAKVQNTTNNTNPGQEQRGYAQGYADGSNNQKYIDNEPSETQSSESGSSSSSSG